MPIPSVNILKLVETCTPTRYRKPRITALFRVLNIFLAEIYAKWSNYRLEKAYILSINSQVCRLRKLLNDKFDYTQRRITIGEGQRIDRDYLFLEAENRPVYLGINYLYLNSEFADSSFDFIINLNGVILSNDKINQLKNFVNFFKLAGKRYKITP